MRFGFGILMYLGLGALLCLGQDRNTSEPHAPVMPAQPSYVPVHTFDAARDAAADIAAAIEEARKTGKRVLIEVGGDWCPWCHKLDQFFHDNAVIARLRDANFVVVNVYHGSENRNEKVLSHYSKVLGIPHFFVLDKDGTLLHSQHVLDLKMNSDYSPGKMKDFLMKWSPTAPSGDSEF